MTLHTDNNRAIETVKKDIFNSLTGSRLIGPAADVLKHFGTTMRYLSNIKEMVLLTAVEASESQS